MKFESQGFCFQLSYAHMSIPADCSNHSYQTELTQQQNPLSK